MEWRDVTGYGCRYRVSDTGIVQGCRSGHWRDKKVKDLATADCVTLIGQDQRHHSVTIGRLVYQAFIGPVPDGYKVLHRNGLKWDHRPENLKLAKPGSPMGGSGLNRRCVVAEDRHGNVTFYPSMLAAAKAEGLCVETIRARCLFKGDYRPFSEKTGKRYSFDEVE